MAVIKALRVAGTQPTRAECWLVTVRILKLNSAHRQGESCKSYPIVSAMASAFPSGLRVLAVDDDPAFLKILEQMLKKCSYEG